MFSIFVPRDTGAAVRRQNKTFKKIRTVLQTILRSVGSQNSCEADGSERNGQYSSAVTTGVSRRTLEKTCAVAHKVLFSQQNNSVTGGPFTLKRGRGNIRPQNKCSMHCFRGYYFVAHARFSDIQNLFPAGRRISCTDEAARSTTENAG